MKWDVKLEFHIPFHTSIQQRVMLRALRARNIKGFRKIGEGIDQINRLRITAENCSTVNTTAKITRITVSASS